MPLTTSFGSLKIGWESILSLCPPIFRIARKLILTNHTVQKILLDLVSHYWSMDFGALNISFPAKRCVRNSSWTTHLSKCMWVGCEYWHLHMLQHWWAAGITDYFLKGKSIGKTFFLSPIHPRVSRTPILLNPLNISKIGQKVLWIRACCTQVLMRMKMSRCSNEKWQWNYCAGKRVSRLRLRKSTFQAGSVCMFHKANDTCDTYSFNGCCLWHSEQKTKHECFQFCFHANT